MKKFLIFLIVAGLLAGPLALKQAAASPVMRDSPAGASDTLGPQILEAPATDSYIVRLTPGVTAEQAGLDAWGEVFPYPELSGTGINFAVVRPADDSQRLALEAIASGGDLSAAMSADILSVEGNGYAVLQGWPTDPMYTNGQQWGIYAGGLGMSFPKTGTAKTVAVVDTGQAQAHEDLPTVASSDRITVLNGRITYGNCTDSPYEGHGTHVTGIFAMTHNNQKGGVGVMAQTGRILCIKSFHGFSASWADAAWGVLYAGVEKAKFLNASWGGSGDNQLVTAAIEFYLSQGDSYFVAACGNYGSQYPGCIFPASLAGKPGFEHVVSVGALNAGLNPASFSQYGGTVWAPGEQICSTFPTNEYKCWSGTSMATPYALGVIASILERHPMRGMELLAYLQTCSLSLAFGGRFPRWKCIGAVEETFLPLILKQP